MEKDATNDVGYTGVVTFRKTFQLILSVQLVPATETLQRDFGIQGLMGTYGVLCYRLVTQMSIASASTNTLNKTQQLCRR